MLEYTVKRVAQILLIVFLALTIVFFLQFLAGDPVLLYMPIDTPRERLEAERERLGFNDPILVQYLCFVADAIRGDFGDSFRYDTKVLPLVVSRIPATAQLVLTASILSLALAMFVGVVSAANHRSWIDQLGIALTSLGQAIPPFWLGIMAILVFSVLLRWLPTGGRGDLRHMIMPVLTLAAGTTARLARLTRSSILDVLRSDYVRTARSKGLSESIVLYKHALRNALIPVITLFGMTVGRMLGGVVVLETVFYWPGLGRMIVDALLRRDFAVVLSGVFVASVFIGSLNLLVDLSYALLDPRIRYG